MPRGAGGYGVHLVRVRGVCGECGVEFVELEEGGEIELGGGGVGWWMDGGEERWGNGGKWRGERV